MSLVLIAAFIAATASVVAMACIAYIVISFRRSSRLVTSRVGRQPLMLVTLSSARAPVRVRPMAPARRPGSLRPVAAH